MYDDNEDDEFESNQDDENVSNEDDESDDVTDIDDIESYDDLIYLYRIRCDQVRDLRAKVQELQAQLALLNAS